MVQVSGPRPNASTTAGLRCGGRANPRGAPPAVSPAPTPATASECAYRNDGYGRLDMGQLRLVYKTESSARIAPSAPGRSGASPQWRPRSAIRRPACNHCPMSAQITGPRSPAEAGIYGQHDFGVLPVFLMSVQRSHRVVLPSPNGATICWSLATTGVRVVAGCLRNASAVGRFLAGRGWSVAVIAGGERWPGVTVGIRPCFEDLLGAGAVLSGLPQNDCSPEALAAVATYQRFESNLPETLMNCVGGRELTA